MSPEEPQVHRGTFSVEVRMGEEFEPGDRLRAALDGLAVAVAEETEDAGDEEVSGFMQPGTLAVGSFDMTAGMGPNEFIRICKCKQADFIKCTGMFGPSAVQRPGI